MSYDHMKQRMTELEYERTFASAMRSLLEPLADDACPLDIFLDAYCEHDDADPGGCEICVSIARAKQALKLKELAARTPPVEAEPIAMPDSLTTLLLDAAMWRRLKMQVAGGMGGAIVDRAIAAVERTPVDPEWLRHMGRDLDTRSIARMLPEMRTIGDASRLISELLHELGPVAVRWNWSIESNTDGRTRLIFEAEAARDRA